MASNFVVILCANEGAKCLRNAAAVRLPLVGFPNKRQIKQRDCDDHKGCEDLDAVEKLVKARHIGFCEIGSLYTS